MFPPLRRRLYTNVAALSPAAGGGGGGDEAETTTLVSAMTSAGSTPDATRTGYINTLIAALKSAGVWTKLDVLHVYAAHAESVSKINWKNPGTFDGTKTGSPGYVIDEGYTGTGFDTAYINTGFNPATATTPNYTQNSAHQSVYIRNSITSSARDTGAATGNANVVIVGHGSQNTMRFFGPNDAGATDTNTVTASSQGHLMVNRSAAGARQAYRNGASVHSDTQASSSVVSGIFSVLADPTAGQGATRQVSIFHTGSSLDATEASNAYNAFQAFMTSLGKQV